MAKFKKGESGNKSGRPPGTPDRRSQLRELLKPHAGKLVKVAVDMALGGDTTALRICIDRILPPLRPQSEPVTIGDFPATATLAEKGAAIFQAVTAGQITTEEGAALIGILAVQARIVEVSGLEERIKWLEKQQRAGGGQ